MIAIRATFPASCGFISMIPQAADSWTIDEAAHLLSRAGFGGSPVAIKALHALGRKAAVDLLVSAQDAAEEFPFPEWARKEQALAELVEQRRELRQMRLATRDLSPQEAEKAKRMMRKDTQARDRQRGLEAHTWWVNRMLRSKAPLREKMTLFWHDHFATSVQKVKQPITMVWQNDLFRRHATGNFKELTHAILMDPAMMRYLDTQDSQKGKPNENFAREIMELFTLGEGHYTEADIREAARAFTGYEFDPTIGAVWHNKRRWDETPKTIFGKTGNFNGGDVINLIFDQAQPAKFMAAKVWEFFAYENPPPKAVDALAETLRKSNYELAPLLREIFLSKEFYSAACMGTQIKCPIQFVIQLQKQLEFDGLPPGFAQNAQQQLGQILFAPPNVAGWDWGKAWINTNTLLARYNLAGVLCKNTGKSDMKQLTQGGNIPRFARMRRTASSWTGPDYEKIAPLALRENPEKLVESLVFRFFHRPLPTKASLSFVEFAQAKNGTSMTDGQVAELCHLMLSTPHYQLC
jgi:uncharacterized protein (DUF1800 family)